MNPLDELEARLRQEAKHWTASPTLEATLLREMGNAPTRRVLKTTAVVAIAAALLLTLWPARSKPTSKPNPTIAHAPKPEPVTAVQVHQPRRRHQNAPKPATLEFIRIPYSAPLEPGERTEIVRVELPVSAFASTGLQIATSDTSAKAQADLVIGEDGMARAIRLISILNN